MDLHGQNPGFYGALSTYPKTISLWSKRQNFFRARSSSKRRLFFLH
jgi:hypothetical protein